MADARVVHEPSQGCRRVQRPVRHKIFIHSPPKTATSQLGSYLGRLGYRLSGWMGDKISILKWDARIKAINHLFAKDATFPPPESLVARANETLASLMRFASQDAFHDAPLGVIRGGLEPQTSRCMYVMCWLSATHAPYRDSTPT